MLPDMPPKTIADARQRDRRDKRAVSAPRRGSQARVLRIIGGAWRGRRLRFPAQATIRPTPDRVRETLFNWLGNEVVGARCLDLFAGSGALGLEALSRGAVSVQFIERDRVAARELARILEEWGPPRATEVRARPVPPAPQVQPPQVRAWDVRRADALAWLTERAVGEQSVPFDIVFLDPPFDSGLVSTAAERLEGGGWLTERALIYIEHATRAGLPRLPAHWTVRKSGHAGEVEYHLLERAASLLERVAP